MRAINSKAGIWRSGNERNHLGAVPLWTLRGLTQEIKCQALPREIFIYLVFRGSWAQVLLILWSGLNTQPDSKPRLKSQWKDKRQNRVQSLSSSMKTHAERKNVIKETDVHWEIDKHSNQGGRGWHRCENLNNNTWKNRKGTECEFGEKRKRCPHWNALHWPFYRTQKSQGGPSRSISSWTCGHQLSEMDAGPSPLGHISRWRWALIHNAESGDS